MQQKVVKRMAISTNRERAHSGLKSGSKLYSNGSGGASRCSSNTLLSFYIFTSGDSLLRDIQRILTEPIILLARQAETTHDQSDILESTRQT